MAGKQLMCMKCEKTESLPSEMETHLVKDHSVKQRMCPVCGKRVVDMAYHLKTHNEEAQIECEISGCGKRFFSQHNLRAHMLSHSAVKNFTCHVCNGEFRHEANLKRHLAKSHPNVKGETAEGEEVVEVEEANNE